MRRNGVTNLFVEMISKDQVSGGEGESVCFLFEAGQLLWCEVVLGVMKV